MQGNVPLEAQGWTLLGETWLEQDQLEDAERALAYAFRLGQNGGAANLPYSYGLLGALKLAQGDYDRADLFTRRAMEMRTGAPEFLLLHQRGKIRSAREISWEHSAIFIPRSNWQRNRGKKYLRPHRLWPEQTWLWNSRYSTRS